MRAVRALGLGILGLLITAVAGCVPSDSAEGTHFGGDRPTYASAADLTTSSDLVVRGTVGTLRGTELDDGGLGGNDGVPMKFFNFDPDVVLAGTPTGDPFVLGWVDNSTGVYEGVSDLDIGDHVELFLSYRTDADTPGITSESDFYVVLSDDNGVLDIVGNNVVARSPELTSLEGLPNGGRVAHQAQDGGLFTAPLEDFERVVEEYA